MALTLVLKVRALKGGGGYVALEKLPSQEDKEGWGGGRPGFVNLPVREYQHLIFY